MLFKSVFDSVGEVREEISNGRIDPSDVLVDIDKTSLTISLDDEFFEEYDSDEYYISPNEPHRKQVLFYGEYRRPQELCVELLSEFLSDEELYRVEYRGLEDSTEFL